MKIVAIIQARMGSTRLPGKTLMPIAGQPLLWHVIHHLKASRLITQIAIATSTNPLDDAIVDFAAAHNVMVIRGPEDNVLARFARAAEQTDADIIVRVSSDALFLDAGFIDHLVGAMMAQNADYVMMEGACAHQGVDPLTRKGLDKLMMDAPGDPVAREHVTGYFKLHPDFVPIAVAPSYPLLAHEAGRLTIDTREDLDFAQAIHARLGVRAGEARLVDVVALLARAPELRQINRHVRQKPLRAHNGLALIRVDGGGKFGYGHVKRMVALARALRDVENIAVMFALNGSDDALAPIRRAGFEAKKIASHADLAAMIAAHHPSLLLLDGRENPPRALLESWRNQIALMATIDDGSDARLACDFAYYPPVPQVAALDWTGARTVPRIGWDWSLTGLLPPVAPERGHAARPTVLVAMGGSDPFGLTMRAATALTALDSTFRIRFVIGTGMKDARRTAAAIVALKVNYETVEGADDLATEYASADLALCAFGVTAYELAAFGVPAIYLGLTPDHALSASAFVEAGMGKSLGVMDAVQNDDIAGAVRALMLDIAARRDMRSRGPALLDGKGALRVAGDLAAGLREEALPKAARIPA